MTLLRALGVSLLFAVGGCRSTSNVTCSFSDKEWHFCQADTRQGARLLKQTSAIPCVPGKTWGWDDKGIWVDQGCGGQFALDHGDMGAYGVAVPPLPPAQQARDRMQKAEPASEQSCEMAIGKKEAKKLVDECLQVSPATHPPCNAANSCSLIKAEIRRSCELIGRDAPKFCEEFRETAVPSQP